MLYSNVVLACTEKQCGVLSDLLHELVELTRAGHDDHSGGDAAMEAACCLGVIGVIDVGLVARRGRPANVELESALSVMHDSAKMQQYCHMFHALADCLTDSQLVLPVLCRHSEIRQTDSVLILDFIGFHCFYCCLPGEPPSVG